MESESKKVKPEPSSGSEYPSFEEFSSQKKRPLEPGELTSKNLLEFFTKYEAIYDRFRQVNDVLKKAEDGNLVNIFKLQDPKIKILNDSTIIEARNIRDKINNFITKFNKITELKKLSTDLIQKEKASEKLNVYYTKLLNDFNECKKSSDVTELKRVIDVLKRNASSDEELKKDLSIKIQTCQDNKAQLQNKLNELELSIKNKESQSKSQVEDLTSRLEQFKFTKEKDISNYDKRELNLKTEIETLKKTKSENEVLINRLKNELFKNISGGVCSKLFTPIDLNIGDSISKASIHSSQTNFRKKNSDIVYAQNCFNIFAKDGESIYRFVSRLDPIFSDDENQNVLRSFLLMSFNTPLVFENEKIKDIITIEGTTNEYSSELVKITHHCLLEGFMHSLNKIYKMDMTQFKDSDLIDAREPNQVWGEFLSADEGQAKDKINKALGFAAVSNKIANIFLQFTTKRLYSRKMPFITQISKMLLDTSFLANPKNIKYNPFDEKRYDTLMGILTEYEKLCIKHTVTKEKSQIAIWSNPQIYAHLLYQYEDSELVSTIFTPTEIKREDKIELRAVNFKTLASSFLSTKPKFRDYISACTFTSIFRFIHGEIIERIDRLVIQGENVNIIKIAISMLISHGYYIFNNSIVQQTPAGDFKFLPSKYSIEHMYLFMMNRLINDGVQFLKPKTLYSVYYFGIDTFTNTLKLKSPENAINSFLSLISVIIADSKKGQENYGISMSPFVATMIYLHLFFTCLPTIINMILGKAESKTILVDSKYEEEAITKFMKTVAGLKLTEFVLTDLTTVCNGVANQISEWIKTSTDNYSTVSSITPFMFPYQIFFLDITKKKDLGAIERILLPEWDPQFKDAVQEASGTSMNYTSFIEPFVDTSKFNEEGVKVVESELSNIFYGEYKDVLESKSIVENVTGGKECKHIVRKPKEPLGVFLYGISHLLWAICGSGIDLGVKDVTACKYRLDQLKEYWDKSPVALRQKIRIVWPKKADELTKILRFFHDMVMTIFNDDKLFKEEVKEYKKPLNLLYMLLKHFK